MSATIVLIEDDRLIAEPIARALEGRGYTTHKAYDGGIGLQLALTQAPDLVILDIMLPTLDGWEVCKAIRQQSVVPILMLTALGDEIDRVLGLELGADDYVSKPFSTRELLARVKALLRRVELDASQAKPATPPRISFGLVAVDVEGRRVFKAGQELALRFKEFELFQLLLNHAGEIVTRGDIFEQVWGTDWLGDTRTLDVHIRWLREKLEDDPSNPRYIQTIRNVGYRLVLDT